MHKCKQALWLENRKLSHCCNSAMTCFGNNVLQQIVSALGKSQMSYQLEETQNMHKQMCAMGEGNLDACEWW